MLYPWLTPLLAAIACLALAGFVLVRGPKNELGRVFTLAALVLASFNLFYFVLYYVRDYDAAFYWARVFRVGTLLTTPVGVHLAVALRPERSRAWNALLAVNYALATLFILGNLFDLYVDGLVRIPWGYATTRAPLYEVLTVYTVANAAAAMGLVAYQYRTAVDPRMRLRSKFWVIGVTIGLSLGLTNFLPAYGIPIYPFGHFGSVAFAAILAYAIVRHRLLGVEVVVTKSIAYTGVFLLVVGPAFAISVVFQKLIFAQVNYEFSLVMLTLLLLTGVLFPFARNWAEGRLEESLFRETHRVRAALADFAKSTLRIIDEDDLVSELCSATRNAFRLDRIALLMLDEHRGVFRVRESLGPPPASSVLEAEHPIFKWLGARNEPMLSEEVEGIDSGPDREAIVSLLSENQWKVCVPLGGGGRMLGFLALGAKPDIEAFVQGDLEVLGTLAAEASIAFDNARLYEELRRSQDLITRAGRLSALGTFAAGIAHEIRNPLVSIQTFFQLAPQRLGDEEFMTSFLPLAEAELVRIRKLITELLSFAKSSSATVQNVNLPDVVERAVTLLHPMARGEHVDLVVHGNAVTGEVEADPEQLLQVLINLILNAIQASPSGAKVMVRLGHIVTPKASYVRVSIEDRGAGVPPELREAIFNPFFTTKEKGTGLGLSIVHRIVDDVGGRIMIEDREGGGSCFVVELPEIPARADEADRPDSSGFLRSVG